MEGPWSAEGGADSKILHILPFLAIVSNLTNIEIWSMPRSLQMLRTVFFGGGSHYRHCIGHSVGDRDSHSRLSFLGASHSPDSYQVRCCNDAGWHIAEPPPSLTVRSEPLSTLR